MTLIARWTVLAVAGLALLGCASGPSKRPEPEPEAPSGGPGTPGEDEENLLEDQERSQLFLDLDRYTEEWQVAREMGRVSAYAGLERLLRRKIEDNLAILLESAASRDDPRRRLIASKSLGFTPDPKARQALSTLLLAEDPAIVANALMGLSLQPGAGAPVDRIALHLDSYDRSVQQNAALALYRALRDGATLGAADRERALTRLHVLLLDTERATIRGNAAAALGEFGGPSVEGELIGVLKDEDVYPRIRAIVALASIGTEACLDPLIAMLATDEANVRRRAANALWIVTRRLGYEIDGRVLGEDPHAWREAIRARRGG